MIEVFKILKSFKNIDPNRFIQVVGEHGIGIGTVLVLFKRRYTV